jgi:FMN reductase
MKVVVLVGSMRECSTSRDALRLAAEGARLSGAEVAWLDLRLLGLPFCDGRDDVDSYGEGVSAFRAAVAAADALLVGSPEYHGSMSGALKNAVDLLGIEPLKGKMVGLLAVARGDAGAMNTLNHLRHVFRWVQAWVLPTQVSIPRSKEAFDASGQAVRPGLDDELKNLGQEVVRYARLLAGNGRSV